MTYLVQMMGGEEHIVPENVGEAILEAKVDRVVWNNMMLNLKSISICKPYNDISNYLELPKPKIFTKSERLRALEQMIKGLNKCIYEDGNSNERSTLLNKMNDKLNKTKFLSEKLLTSSPLNDFESLLIS